MADAKYRAFISYSHKDDKWAAWLHRALESYKPPKHLVGQRTAMGVIPKRLAPVFRDREELPSATDLGAVINEALTQSACQIVVCSPAAARSKWVNEEILAFKRLGREDRILCLIVDGEPNVAGHPDIGDRECFPQAVRFKLDANGGLSNEHSEPIAADARPDKDGKGNAKIKLIAGMLGVGFDALRQRELHRRHRRMVAIATASIGGMVVTTVLAVAALLARAEAELQRERAAMEAETARQTTDFLVEIFEVSDPSEALGSTITAREILDRGARRIEFELESQPAIQATLMDTMGTVYKNLGLYADARTLLERGLSTRRSLYGEQHLDVARSEANLGELLGFQSDLDEAARVYESSIAALRTLTEPQPDALAASLVGQAVVRSLQGDHGRAEALLREAIDLQRPTPGSESLPLARSIDQLGITLMDQARYDEAEAMLREALAMRRRLVPRGIHPEIDDSLNNLAVFLYQAGNYDEAGALFRESLEINARLLGDRHPDVAMVLNNLAVVTHESGQLDAAGEFFRSAVDIRLEAFGELHPMTAQSFNSLAFLYFDQGRLDESIEASRRALAGFRSAYPGDHLEVVAGLQNLARGLVQNGNYAEAEPLLDEALGMVRRLVADDHPDVAITQSGMAALLLETDRAEAARAMAATAAGVLAAALGEDHWRVAWARTIEGASLVALGRSDDAEALLLDSYARLSEGATGRRMQIDFALRSLVALYSGSARPAEADRYRAMQSQVGGG